MNKLVAAAIGMYIGISFLPGLQSTIGCITVANGYTVGVVGMAGVLLIIFMWAIIKGGLD